MYSSVSCALFQGGESYLHPHIHTPQPNGVVDAVIVVVEDILEDTDFLVEDENKNGKVGVGEDDCRRVVVDEDLAKIEVDDF